MTWDEIRQAIQNIRDAAATANAVYRHGDPVQMADALLAALESEPEPPPCACGGEEECPSCRAPLWIKRGIKVCRRGLDQVGEITDIGAGYDDEPWRYRVVFKDGIHLWLPPHELVPVAEKPDA